MGDRLRITLACDECGARNYKTSKGRRASQGERFSIKKFCPTCNKHTQHSETK